jgi:hypothetical protein
MSATYGQPALALRRPPQRSGLGLLGTIVSVDLEKQLTGRIMGAYLPYVLVPRKPGAAARHHGHRHNTKRLLLKVVMQRAAGSPMGCRSAIGSWLDGSC